jgi:hypothetical protein
MQNKTRMYRQTRYLLSALMLMVGSFFPHANVAEAAVTVPITVQELLPSKVSGMDRINEPVTVGIPLAEGSGVTSVSQLGLDNVSAGQFRTLGYWPNGNIKWVLVDFQSSLSAGSTNTNVSLTDGGAGNFGGADLATDNGSTITVDTGAAQFTIKKANFSVFDTVTVGGKPLVGSGGRVEATDASGTIYSSANDGSSTAVIEENGPVRTVVKATGALKSGSGTRLMDYTLRLHFYKDKAYVKSFATLRNANKTNRDDIAFRSFRVVVPMSLGSGQTVTLSRKTDEVTRPLTGAAVLEQGHSTAFTYPYVETSAYTWTPPVPGTPNVSTNVFTYDPAYEGLHAQVGSETLNAFGDKSEWTQGYASIQDATDAGVTLAMRWMGGYWPATFRISAGGETSIDLFGGWPSKNYVMQWGKHETREIMWDFHTSAVAGTAVIKRLQYPLAARADLTYYQSVKAFFNQSEMLSPADETEVFSSLGKTVSNFSNAAMTQLYRTWPWSQSGGDNQTDTSQDQLQMFLRTGSSSFYLIGEQRTLMLSDAAVTHSDDYTTERLTAGTSLITPTERGISGVFIDIEHANVGGLFFYYFLTGNEEVKDSYTDYGELMYRTQLTGWFKIPETNYLRAWSRKARNLALAYEFGCIVGSCNDLYKSQLVNTVNTVLDSRDVVGSKTAKGRNLERGYLYWDVTLDGSSRVVHSFFHTTIYFEAMWQILRIMDDYGWNYARQPEFEDYLTGLSHFFFDEYLDTYPVSHPNYSLYKYGFNYDYLLDSYAVQTLTPYDASRAAVWYYRHTGDPSVLAKGILLSSTSWNYMEELQAQALYWTYKNADTVPTWKDLPVNVVNNGGGSYTLSWTVPAGATDYQIKYSDKPIVEWLGFNKVDRTYQYAPSGYTAFFAANNISSNPTPAAAGSAQSYTVTGLDPAQSWNFSAKVLTGDTTPPDTVITSHPTNPTTSTSADFAFASTEPGATFECKLDGGSYGACVSPKSYSGLSLGSHTFSVRSTDTSANVDPSPASMTWTILPQTP